MMNNNIKDSERNINTWSRFLEVVRRTDSRRSRSDLEFFTSSAVPALLTMQFSFKPEQL